MGQEWSAPKDMKQVFFMLKKKSWDDGVEQHIMMLYTRYGGRFHTYSPFGLYPLEHAIVNDNPDGVEFLLNQCHADIEGPYPKVRIRRCVIGFIEAESFVTWACIIHLQDRDGPMWWAGARATFKMIKLLFGKYKKLHKNLSHSLVRSIIRCFVFKNLVMNLLTFRKKLYLD